MREIKFRVWDNDLKDMHVCGENEHDTIYFFGNIAAYYNLQNSCGSLKDEQGKSTYELMQFTGLRDKNGREVYEGDIFKCIPRGCPHAIEWVNDIGGTFWGGMPGFSPSGLCRNGGKGYAWTGDEEVMGNIYENPDLLLEDKS